MKSLLVAVALFCQCCVPVALAADLPAALQGLGLREAPVATRDMVGWQATQKIVLRNLFGAGAVKALQDAVPGVTIVPVGSVAEAVQAIPGAQVLIGYCEQEILAAADQLRWVQYYFAGVEDCVSQPGMRTGDIMLSNGQRLSGPTIGDHSIALMYALVRGLDGFHGKQASGEWNRNAVSSLTAFGEISGRTLLVVGLGGIGTQVAERAHALGMRVLATRGSRRQGPAYIEYVGLADEAMELARRADVVVNAAPLTDATRGMFNSEFFAAMKPTAYFISVGRGQSTVTADLVNALKRGQIAGAGLDVTDPEPLPADHELWRLPRVLITPHMAAMSAESYQRIVALVAENARRYIAGEPLLSVVNIDKGY